MRWTPAYDRMFDPDNDLGGEPVCRRWAFLDLCHMAQVRPGNRFLERGAMEYLERGQVLASERFLATRWRWSRSKVHRFLGSLCAAPLNKLRHVRDSQAGGIYEVISYDRYALGGASGGVSTNSHRSDQQTDHQSNQGLPLYETESTVSRTSDRTSNRATDEPPKSQTLDRRDTSSSPREDDLPPPPGRNLGRLVEWLGEGHEDAVRKLAGDDPESWCRAFIGTWVETSMLNEKDRAKAGEGVWKAAVQDALSAMILEDADYNQRFFRSMVLDRLNPKAPPPRPTARRGNPMSVGTLPAGAR